jgi:MFS family permease
MDPVAAPAKPSRPAEVLAYLRTRPTILHLIVGMVLNAMAISATGAWMVSFLIRQHGLPQAQSGAASAIALGFFSALGGLLAGLAADRFGQDKRGQLQPQRMAQLAMVATIMVAVAGAAALQVASMPLALGLLFTFSFFSNACYSPANSLLLTLLQPRMRGLTIAGYQVLANLVGYGVGPFLVGLLSDKIGGTRSLGSAMTIILMINFWAALHFWFASRSVQRDLPSGAQADAG